MKTERLPLIFFILFCSFLKTGISQTTSGVQHHTQVKKIWDIPHKTVQEKFLWPHRVFAYEVTKERKINYDTNYIHSFRRSFVVTLPLSTRFLSFSVIDRVSNNKLTFAPNLQYNLGLSVSSRWMSFILNSGVQVFHNDTDKKGKTSHKDFQLNLYGRKFTTDMFVQYYRGFYIKNSQSYSNYISDSPYDIQKDAYALNMGVSTYYIINNKRFSYRNSFAFAEQQKKSAGSLLIGIYYSYFDVTGSPSLITDPFRTSFDTSSYIKSAHAHNFGLNLGYIYTLVFLKKCYITGSLVQGFGAQQAVHIHDDNSIDNQMSGGAGKINIRLALGYDGGRFFFGAMGVTDYYLLKGKTAATFDYSFGKVMVFTGYRFSIKKTERRLLRRFKLIDY